MAVTKHSFTAEARYAVYTTHGSVCYQCRRPVDLKSFEVDHIIPESLAADPGRLRQVLDDLGRPPDFELNSYENWMPSCRPCNNEKRTMVFDSTPLIQRTLQRAADRADAARALEKRTVERRDVAAALNVLERVAERGEFRDEMPEWLQPLVAAYAVDRREGDDDVFRVTPDYQVPLFEVLSEEAGVRVVRGPFGIGGGPIGEPALAMRCRGCGLPYFNGTRCVACGQMDDGD